MKNLSLNKCCQSAKYTINISICCISLPLTCTCLPVYQNSRQLSCLLPVFFHPEGMHPHCVVVFLFVCLFCLPIYNILSLLVKTSFSSLSETDVYQPTFGLVPHKDETKPMPSREFCNQTFDSRAIKQKFRYIFCILYEKLPYHIA